MLEAWYPGQSGGLAIANVLTGKTNPAGRLPLTFYRSTDDLPPFDDYAMAGRTYRYFEGKPVYPFGYGLSYTRFDYGPLKVEPAAKGAGQGMRVTTTIRNAGSRAGEEVAQLYLNFPDAPGAPRLALRGFQRVALKPGETREVSFALSSRDLSAVDLDGERKRQRGALSRQRRLRPAGNRRPRPDRRLQRRSGGDAAQISLAAREFVPAEPHWLAGHEPHPDLHLAEPEDAFPCDRAGQRRARKLAVAPVQIDRAGAARPQSLYRPLGPGRRKRGQQQDRIAAALHQHLGDRCRAPEIAVDLERIGVEQIRIGPPVAKQQHELAMRMIALAQPCP
jgi:hypothetical protein